METLTNTPTDLRLMRWLTRACCVGFAITFLAILGLFLVRLPIFNVQSIVMTGDLTKLSPTAIEKAARKSLSGTLLTTNLQTLRSEVASHPWVRHVNVHRRFPDQLILEISEHVPVAVWGKTDEDNIQMLNTLGEIFEANPNDIETDTLVQFFGPDANSAQVLAMFHELSPVFQSAQQSLNTLHLSSRGTWSSKTALGANLEMGSGDASALKNRLFQFFATLPSICNKLGTSPLHLESADLRYPNGYALKLRGVTTQTKPGSELALASKAN